MNWPEVSKVPVGLYWEMWQDALLPKCYWKSYIVIVTLKSNPLPYGEGRVALKIVARGPPFGDCFGNLLFFKTTEFLIPWFVL